MSESQDQVIDPNRYLSGHRLTCIEKLTAAVAKTAITLNLKPEAEKFGISRICVCSLN